MFRLHTEGVSVWTPKAGVGAAFLRVPQEFHATEFYYFLEVNFWTGLEMPEEWLW